jgi:hypothetical protein
MMSPTADDVFSHHGLSYADFCLFVPYHDHYTNALGVKHVINDVTGESFFVQNNHLLPDRGGLQSVDFSKPYADHGCICNVHEQALTIMCQDALCIGARALDARARTFDTVRRYADGSMSRVEMRRLSGVVNQIVQVYKSSSRALCEPVDELLASQMHMSFSAGTGKWFTVAEVTECYMQHNRAVPVPSETWRGFE